MGRKKITIVRIADDRIRNITFHKRRMGIQKKAMELSILCECDVVMAVFGSDGKCYQFATNNEFDSLIRQCGDCDTPAERLDNERLQQILNEKKEREEQRQKVNASLGDSDGNDSADSESTTTSKSSATKTRKRRRQSSATEDQPTSSSASGAKPSTTTAKASAARRRTSSTASKQASSNKNSTGTGTATSNNGNSTSNNSTSNNTNSTNSSASTLSVENLANRSNNDTYSNSTHLVLPQTTNVLGTATVPNASTSGNTMGLVVLDSVGGGGYVPGKLQMTHDSNAAIKEISLLFGNSDVVRHNVNIPNNMQYNNSNSSNSNSSGNNKLLHNSQQHGGGHHQPSFVDSQLQQAIASGDYFSSISGPNEEAQQQQQQQQQQQLQQLQQQQLQQLQQHHGNNIGIVHLQQQQQLLSHGGSGQSSSTASLVHQPIAMRVVPHAIMIDSELGLKNNLNYYTHHLTPRSAAIINDVAAKAASFSRATSGMMDSGASAQHQHQHQHHAQTDDSTIGGFMHAMDTDAADSRSRHGGDGATNDATAPMVIDRSGGGSGNGGDKRSKFMSLSIEVPKDDDDNDVVVDDNDDMSRADNGHGMMLSSMAHHDLVKHENGSGGGGQSNNNGPPSTLVNLSAMGGGTHGSSSFSLSHHPPHPHLLSHQDSIGSISSLLKTNSTSSLLGVPLGGDSAHQHHMPTQLSPSNAFHSSLQSPSSLSYFSLACGANRNILALESPSLYSASPSMSSGTPTLNRTFPVMEKQQSLTSLLKDLRSSLAPDQNHYDPS